jgi:hypothetical protein
VQYSELTHYHLIKEMSFPTSKSLQCKFWVKRAASCVDRGAFPRLCAGRIEEKKRLSARCAPVGGNNRAPASKSPGGKYGFISPQSLMDWLICSSAEAGL